MRSEVSTAPTGTYPPDSALETVMMSGSSAPVFVAEEFPRAAESRLDLVDDQQRLVPPTELLHLLPVVGRRHVDALPLNRLHDECRHVPPPHLGAQGRDIPEGHGGGARQQVAETLAEVRAAVE